MEVGFQARDVAFLTTDAATFLFRGVALARRTNRVVSVVRDRPESGGSTNGVGRVPSVQTLATLAPRDDRRNSLPPSVRTAPDPGMRGSARSVPRLAARGDRPRASALLAFFLALALFVPAAHAWGFGSADPPDEQALEDRFAEDFEAPIYRASQLSMDTAADLETERKANAAKARLAQRRRANINAPPLFEWRYEGVGIAVVVAYVLNYLRGNAANRNVARAFEEAFLSCDASEANETSHSDGRAVFRSEFAEVGKLAPSDPTHAATPLARNAARLSREAPDEYRCWATGRRFLTGALVTLRLRKRHDLFRLAYEFRNPAMAEKDEVVVECFFRDGVVGPGFGFALGPADAMRGLEKSELGRKDIARLCEKCAGPKDAAGRRRLSASLVLKAESAELGADVVFDRALETLFSERAYAAKADSVGACFKTAHLVVGSAPSSGGVVAAAFDAVRGDDAAKDAAASPYTGSLRFTFELPDAAAGAAGYRARLGELIALVPRLVDVVARVRLSDAQKEKAAKERKRVEDEDFRRKLKTSAKENASARLDAKLEKMSDKEKQRWREKQAKKQTRKAGGRTMIRKG